jgi:hypothetical protein
MMGGCPEGNYTYDFYGNGTPMCRSDVDTDTTCSADMSCADIIYYSNQSNLNVNRSNFWDNLDTPSDISGNEFWYNHTLATYNLWNADWISTYNATYDYWSADYYVNESGDTMTGNLNMSVNNITGVDCITFDSGGQICTGS